MKKIVVKQTENFPIAIFKVEIDGSEYTVELTVEYYKKLTGGVVSPAELIKRSFEFLLEREPKESILKHFDLPTIYKYFPEFEVEIYSGDR